MSFYSPDERFIETQTFAPLQWEVGQLDVEFSQQGAHIDEIFVRFEGGKPAVEAWV